MRDRAGQQSCAARSPCSSLPTGHWKAPMQVEPTAITRAAELLQRLRESIGQAVVGQATVVEQVIVTLIASGHVLIEGVPGLGKTLLVRALAQAMSLQAGRVQFTPDLM